MSKKQPEAAPEGQSALNRRPGWLRRLRAQPGFRTAVIVFFLTVAVGAGGPAAYAYWSQSTQGEITGTAAVPVTPIPDARCLNYPVRIGLSATGADRDARYIVTFTANNWGQRSTTYALPVGTQSVDPSDLELGFGYTVSVSIPATATVRTAVVRPNVSSGTVRVTDADLLWPSKESATVNLWYSSSFFEGIRVSCR